MKSLLFFLLFWDQFGLLGYGSGDPIESGSDPEQEFLWQLKKFYIRSNIKFVNFLDPDPLTLLNQNTKHHRIREINDEL